MHLPWFEENIPFTGHYQAAGYNLPVSNLSSSIAFYKLLNFREIKFPAYKKQNQSKLLEANNIILFLYERNNLRTEEKAQILLIVPNIEVFYNYIVNLNIAIEKDLDTNIFDLREFVIVDPDNNRITISESIK
jgi:predicted lactoylglutathione lyase